MTVIKALVKRHIKKYLGDKATVIASLLVPIVLILLYMSVLKNVYVSNFRSIVGMPLPEIIEDGFIFGWLFSGLMATTGVSVSFCSNIIMTQDRLEGMGRDLRVAPLGKTTLGISYYIANMMTTFVVCCIELVFALIVLKFNGWFLSFGNVLVLVLMTFLNAAFGTAFSSIAFYFTTSNGQLAVINTIVSTGYGFLCGAFMPLNSMGISSLKILDFLPGTYLTLSFRYAFLNGVCKEMVAQRVDNDILDAIYRNFDLKYSFFGHEVTILGSILASVGFVLVMVGIYILINLIFKRVYKRR